MELCMYMADQIKIGLWISGWVQAVQQNKNFVHVNAVWNITQGLYIFFYTSDSDQGVGWH